MKTRRSFCPKALWIFIPPLPTTDAPLSWMPPDELPS